MNMEKEIVPSIPTIKRLPLYLSVLKKAHIQNEKTISSATIAKQLNFEPIQVRKDLSSTGLVGQPRIGFSVPQLIDVLEEFLGYRNVKDAFIVGAGNIGTALMKYKGFADYGLNIAMAFDVDPAKVGTKINGIEIMHTKQVVRFIPRMHLNIAILAVPDSQSQVITDLLVEIGVKAIWNISSTKLNVPDGVIVERVDLVASLAALSSKLKRNIVS